MAVLALRHQLEDDDLRYRVLRLQREGVQIADTVNRASSTVIGFMNKEVDIVNVVAIAGSLLVGGAIAVFMIAEAVEPHDRRVHDGIQPTSRRS